MEPEQPDADSPFLVVQLNARLQPMHRVEFFEEPLEARLAAEGLGEISGGGALQQASGEIEYCDIEIEVVSEPEETATALIPFLERLGAPKGSKVHIEATGQSLDLGTTEGMAIYLNGTSLPSETYRNCDSNFVYAELDRLVEGIGRVLSYWQGPTETAFYLYGSSFEEMRTLVSEFLQSYPLCHECRVVQIA